MLKQFQILFVIFCAFSTIAFAQDFIKDFPGIPVRAGLDWYWIDNVSIAEREVILNKMREFGVDIFQIDARRASLLDTIRQKGFKIMPINSPSYKWIQYYTDAKYSLWEAERTPPAVSNAVLEHSNNIMEKIDSGGISFLRLLPSAVTYSDSELIKGPYYQQEIFYYTTEPNSTEINNVEYTAAFRLRLERNLAYEGTFLPENMADTVCMIQVTQSQVSTEGTWHLSCTHVIDSLPITRGQFNQLNNFQDFSIIYDLLSDDCSSSPPPSANSYIETYNRPAQIQDRRLREYIQFKVIWKGNPKYLLSIDKVTVSDFRGREIKGIVPSNAIERINSQDNELSSYYNAITGWLGIDEPLSIDNFEPIRIVDSILSAKSNLSRPVRFDLMSHWDGVWENKNNPFGVMGLSPWDEFEKRVGNMNVCQNAYMYDIPYKNDIADYRAKNIRVFAE